MKVLRFVCLTIYSLFFVWSSPVTAAERTTTDAAASGEQERCIRLSRVKSMDILTNRQMLFEMQGNRFYINTLPYACPGLRRDSTIMYRTSLDLLCDVDVITVLDSTIAGFFPAGTCGIGKFEQVSNREVSDMRAASQK